MKMILWQLIGAVISTLIFSASPAFLLFFQYNFAVAVAYFSLSLTVLFCFWELTGIREKFKNGSSAGQESLMNYYDSRLSSIENHLAEISASTNSIDHDVSKFIISQLPEYPPDAP